MLGRLLHKNMLITFLIMGVSIFVAGVLSIQLFFYFSKNLQFISEHGIDALQEGAFLQFFELSIVGFIALAFYLLFKSCEHVLVDRILKK